MNAPPTVPTEPPPMLPLSGPVAVLLGAAAIGFAPIGLRLSEFGPQATAFWRFAFALPLLALLAHRNGGVSRPTLPALVAGAFFGADIAFWHAGLTHTSVANATFIVNLGNVFAGLTAWMILRQAPSRTWPWAAGLALAGAFLLSGGASSGTGAQLGDLLALVAAVMLSFYVVFAAMARRTASPYSVLFWATCTELLVAAAATNVMGERLVAEHWSWFLAPAALAVVAHVLGQGLIVTGLGRTPAATAGILLLVQPVAGGLVAWQAFGETLTPLQLAGCALILVGVWLASRR